MRGARTFYPPFGEIIINWFRDDVATCAPRALFGVHIFWSGPLFCAAGIPRAAFCDERRERLFCLSSVSINQSQNAARCGLSMIGRVMYVCTMLSITCARLARSLALHSLPPHHTRPTRQTLLCFDVRLFLVFSQAHLANQHVAMPVALNQNLTFEDAMARRIYTCDSLIYTLQSACLARSQTHSQII